MIEWPLPRNVKALRGFLGLTGYYWNFIHHYGIIASPLTDLLKRNAFEWDDMATKAFMALKGAETQPPILKLSDFS